ncbi:MAG: SCP2 sterol-binding domain-containing protein [Acidimicrobiales bacterium]
MPFLSDGWLELLRGLGADLPERPGASARVQHVVTGAPDGEVRYVHTLVDGRTSALEAGGDDAADVTFTNTYADAQALARRELDPSVLFMQGRTKMAGDMGRVLALMPVIRSEEYGALLSAASEQTAY